MVRHGGTPTLPASSSLPVVSFTNVHDVMAHARDTKLSKTLYSYGFTDDSEFTRPESYIQHIEPLESELAVQVEYDMDEQDREWLDMYNKNRKDVRKLDVMSYEVFEIIMDRLEKEWFSLTKNIPKPDFALPSEDSTCAICDDSEGENSNAIVFCDECNLAVHQDCYGIPYIPEGQWLCRKCTVAPDTPVSCLLCPNEGGAFKQTTNGDWCHLLCAIWLPETRVANEVFMEPITGLEEISKARWKLSCSLCRVREGACIQCTKGSCFLAFHVTCARRERFLSPMKSAHGTEPAVLTCYCERHLPEEQAETREAAIEAEEAAEEQNPGHSGKSSKQARAYTKGYKPGPPIVPTIIVNNIKVYTERVKVRKHGEAVQAICRYWSLKREKRRGAPLLKRLHLEPWTASASGRLQTKEEQRMKLDQLHRLLADLVKLKETCWHIMQREKTKVEQVHTVEGILDLFLLYREKYLWEAFGKVKSLDHRDCFLNPVSRADVPDYYEIVKQPMCWATIEAKLNKHEYWDTEPFKRDVELVISNALLYNRDGTLFHRTAKRIEEHFPAILTQLHEAIGKQPSSTLVTETQAESSQSRPQIGDLEPLDEWLTLLTSREAIEPELSFELTDEPLQSLFKFELAKEKPPPPPPPPKSSRESNRGGPRDSKRRAKERGTESTRRTRGSIIIPAARLNAEPGQQVEQVPIDNTALPETKRPAIRRKQPSGTAQEIVPLVEEVDKQKSFKLFDKGWILPPDSKRHNRAPVDRAPSVPRPRKRSRIEAGPSRIPENEGTVPDDQGTILEPAKTVADEEPLDDATMGATDEDIAEPEVTQSSMVTDRPSGPADASTVHTILLEPLSTPPLSRDAIRSRVGRPPDSSASNAKELPPVVKYVTLENGTVVVEELDTPAIRREKSRRRKAEHQPEPTRQENEPTPGPSARPGTLSEPVSAPARSRRGESQADGNTDVSEYSDNQGPKTTKRPVAPKANKKRSKVVPCPQMKSGEPSEGVEFVHGTLVWAKSSTYPWWPASIFDHDDPKVPLSVIQTAERLRAKDKPGSTRHYLQFFDKQKSWELLLSEHLRMLGEDKAFDDLMLAKPSPYQKWKNQNQRDECCRAYKEAITDIETSSEAEPESVEPSN